MLPISGIQGVDVDLTNILSQKMGFSWKVRYETAWVHCDNVTGKVLPVGSFGAVAYNRSDVAIGHNNPDTFITKEYLHPQEVVRDFYPIGVGNAPRRLDDTPGEFQS